MTPTLRRLLLLGTLIGLPSGSVSLAAAPAATTAQTVAEKSAETRARALLKEFYAVKLGNIWAAFTPEVKAQWGTLDGFTQYRQTGVEQFGAEQELVGEKTFRRGDVTYYVPQCHLREGSRGRLGGGLRLRSIGPHQRVRHHAGA